MHTERKSFPRDQNERPNNFLTQTEPKEHTQTP